MTTPEIPSDSTSVFIEDLQSDLPIDLESVKKVVLFSLASESAFCNEITIHFVDRPTICDLHERFFQDPSVTDCITLPIDSPGTLPYCVLGEVFVCPHTAIEYTSTDGKDPYEEVTLYVVHGILHLLGYDDITSDDQKQMRDAEQRVLKYLEGFKVGVTPPN